MVYCNDAKLLIFSTQRCNSNSLWHFFQRRDHTKPLDRSKLCYFHKLARVLWCWIKNYILKTLYLLRSTLCFLQGKVPVPGFFYNPPRYYCKRYPLSVYLKIYNRSKLLPFFALIFDRQIFSCEFEFFFKNLTNLQKKYIYILIIIIIFFMVERFCADWKETLFTYFLQSIQRIYFSIFHKRGKKLKKNFLVKHVFSNSCDVPWCRRNRHEKKDSLIS